MDTCLLPLVAICIRLEAKCRRDCSNVVRRYRALAHAQSPSDSNIKVIRLVPDVAHAEHPSQSPGASQPSRIPASAG